MNILTDIDTNKIAKITYKGTDNCRHIEFIKDSKSVISGEAFTTIPADCVESINYTIDSNELKYYKNKRNLLEYTDGANSDDFFLACSLRVSIRDVVNKNKLILLPAYKQKLIAFVKNTYCRERFNQDMLDNITQIKDDAILLQYMPIDSFYKDLNKTKKYEYMYLIRVRLYYLLFYKKHHFVELFDKERIWASKCIEYFNLPELTFIEFTSPNQTIVEKIKPMWLDLINQSKDRALCLLEGELENAKQYEDHETVKEIEIIKQEIHMTVQNIDLSMCITPLDIMMFWPDILAPGPELMYPYASCFDGYQSSVYMY
jgi:hypothetical protein